jgi:hypothetical protein
MQDHAGHEQPLKGRYHFMSSSECSLSYETKIQGELTKPNQAEV